MKNKKIVVTFISLLVLLLYLILAVRPLGKEYHFEPEWETSILSSTETKTPDNAYPFKLSNKIGYFDSDGNINRLIYCYPGTKATISKEFYITYQTDAQNTELFDKNGNSRGIIPVAGFPYLTDDRLFVFLPGGSSVSRCDDKGNVLWSYQGVLPITAFASKKTSTAIGTSDGTIKVFDTITGELVLEYAPGGSDNPVILGLDITDDGNYIASVSGQDRQRFVLAHKENTQVKIIHHKFLSENYAHQCVVKFTDNEKSVVYNYKNGIGIFNLDTEKSTDIKIDSRIISVEESENIVFFLGKEQNAYTVYLVEKSNSLCGSFSFNANSAFIHADDNYLFVGKDNSLSKIDISKK